MDLSIIYVNWNSLDYLRESIASVYEHTHDISFEIVVVDNASPERGVDTLKDLFPDVLVTKSSQNLGFAGANNVGFRHSTGEYVLFLNPDTQLIAPSINIMLEHAKARSDAGIMGCKLLNSDRSIQLSSIQTFPTILNQALDAEYLRLRWPHCFLWKIAPLFAENATLVPVDVIPGACMLLRRSVFEQAGMFSEDYFMYAEDLDLNYKTKSAGFKNYYVSETAIIHHGGRSSSRQKASNWATIMKYRAMVRLFHKTRGGVYALAYRAAMGVVATARLGLLALMFPLGNMVWKKESVKSAADKWKSVLKWAVGRKDFAI